MVDDTREEAHPQFRDSGASSNRYWWKIRGARRLMQCDLLYIAADLGMCIAMFLVEYDHARQDGHDGEERGLRA
jgi:hypothetical protein